MTLTTLKQFDDSIGLNVNINSQFVNLAKKLGVFKHDVDVNSSEVRKNVETITDTFNMNHDNHVTNTGKVRIQFIIFEVK